MFRDDSGEMGVTANNDSLSVGVIFELVVKARCSKVVLSLLLRSRPSISSATC